MHSKIWLACIVLSSPTLAASLAKAYRSEEDLKSSPLELLSAGNVSIATTDTSNLTDSSNINIPSLNNASQLLSNYSYLYDQSFQSELTSSSATCNGYLYGFGLDVHSCFDAWRNLGLVPDLVSWGPRGSGPNFNYRLPARFSSGETTIKSRKKIVETIVNESLQMMVDVSSMLSIH